MFYIVLYVVLIALSAILRGEVCVKMPDMLLIFISTSTAIGIFSICCWSTLQATYRFMFSNRRLYLLSSTSVMIMSANRVRDRHLFITR